MILFTILTMKTDLGSPVRRRCLGGRHAGDQRHYSHLGIVMVRMMVMVMIVMVRMMMVMVIMIMSMMAMLIISMMAMLRMMLRMMVM